MSQGGVELRPVLSGWRVYGSQSAVDEDTDQVALLPRYDSVRRERDANRLAATCLLIRIAFCLLVIVCLCLSAWMATRALANACSKPGYKYSTAHVVDLENGEGLIVETTGNIRFGINASLSENTVRVATFSFAKNEIALNTGVVVRKFDGVLHIRAVEPSDEPRGFTGVWGNHLCAGTHVTVQVAVGLQLSQVVLRQYVKGTVTIQEDLSANGAGDISPNVVRSNLIHADSLRVSSTSGVSAANVACPQIQISVEDGPVLVSHLHLPTNSSIHISSNARKTIFVDLERSGFNGEFHVIAAAGRPEFPYANRVVDAYSGSGGEYIGYVGRSGGSQLVVETRYAKDVVIRPLH